MRDQVLVERETCGDFCHPNCAISYIREGGDCALFDQHVRRTPDGIMRCAACLDTHGYTPEGGK